MNTISDKTKQCHIRWMIRRDMDEIMDIENRSFPEPWAEEDFITALRKRCCIGLVVEHKEHVIAFCIYELFKTHIELLNMAVHPVHRRTGVGRMLIQKLVSKLRRQGRSRVLLRVVETNLRAQLFFKSLGFKWTATVTGMYRDHEDGAYQMEYSA